MCLVTLLSTSVKSWTESQQARRGLTVHGLIRVFTSTNRNEEARRAIGTSKGFREKFQPSVVAIHDETTIALVLHLRQPRILMCETRRLVTFCKVEDHV